MVISTRQLANERLEFTNAILQHAIKMQYIATIYVIMRVYSLFSLVESCASLRHG